MISRKSPVTFEQYVHRIHVVEIPHAGHVLPLEQPKAVAEAVIAFLRKQL